MMKKTLLLISLCFLSLSLTAQAIPKLPIPLGAGAAQVWGDSIYFIGGSNNWSGSFVYPRIYKYDGSAWTLHDSIPDNNLWDVETALVGDDIYLIAGWPSGANKLRKYNLKSRTWTYLPNSPNSQTWGTTSEYFDGKLYLITSAGSVFAYSISDSTWSNKASAGNTGSLDMSSILYQGNIYVIGFKDSTFYKYSPTNNQWTSLSKSPYQVGACAMGIVNDKIYCVGGNSNGTTGAGYKSVIYYDISNNTWGTDALQLSAKRHWMSKAEYRGGLYVLGGINESAVSVDTVEQIVPQGTSGIKDELKSKPSSFVLNQNYPNPFNPSTVISYQLPINSEVKLEVFDLLGKRVTTLVDSKQSDGSYTVNFNAVNLSSGTYFYRLQATSSGGSFIQTRKMFLVK